MNISPTSALNSKIRTIEAVDRNSPSRSSGSGRFTAGGTGTGTGTGGNNNYTIISNHGKAKKYGEYGESLASLMLSSKVNTIDKNKKYSITLFGEDVNHAFGTSESIEQCVSFCPRNIYHLLNDGGHGHVMGCILLVDISGFTQLSSALCLQGSSGIDMLRKITDNSFAQFVECVYLHGGDVIEFAGDSVLCLFQAEGDTTLSTACHNAVRCGLSLSKFRIDGTHTHVGISCGSISISLVGGYHDQYTYLMNSNCLETVGYCLGAAGEQELVIDDSVFRFVESTFTSSEVMTKDDKAFYKINCERSNWQIMTLGRKKYDQTPPGTPSRTTLAYSSSSTDSEHMTSPYGRKASAFTPLLGSSNEMILPDFSRLHLTLDENRIRQIISCVPRPALQGIITNSLSGLSEMRTVTTLFLKLDSFNFDEYSDPLILDEFFINMQKCLFECGGMLRQFLVDDKGCVLIGLWGVPTASHAANCSKAIRCAVMMQNVSKELGYCSSIGVTTGSVYCGIVGTTYRRDYVAIGRSVNLAARLMCKAQGRILLDDDTFKRLPLNITCYTSFTEKLDLKGIEPGAYFHCYWSTTVPMSRTDISDDRVLVIESYIRRDLQLFVEDMLTPKATDETSNTISVAGSAAYHNRPKLLSRKSFDETIQTSCTANASFHSSFKILIIRGTSASGKTAVANYAIRRIVEAQAKNSHFLAPVYISLNEDDDITPYSTLQKIVRALFAWTQLDGNDQGEFIKKMLLGTFSKYSECVIATYIYPQLRQALGFKWEWTVNHDGSANPFDHSEKSFHLLLSEFLYFVLSDGIPVLAIDDAHFMCSGSWAIITMLSRMGCNARIILTLRVNESISESRLSQETLDDSNMLERSVTPGTKSLLKSGNDSPSRHCSDYLHLCRQVDQHSLFDIVLKPLSKRTIRRIIENEFSMQMIPQETIDEVCSISRGNPYLLWKIIQYVRDSGTRNINEIITNIKDNSFMVSMLDNLPPSHCTVLKLASVIGEEFTTDILEKIVPPKLVQQLTTALQNLENRGFLATVSDGCHIFSSSVIRKFVYDLIPPSEAQETHQLIASQIETIYADSLEHYRHRLCYHYSMSGQQRHKELTVKYSIELIQEFMDRREVESTIPFLAVALKCATNRREYLWLRDLLLHGISICTEHVSNDKSCHRDALSAYTLSRLIDMHGTASLRATFRYTFHAKYCWIRNSFSRLFKKRSIVPVIAMAGSYDYANSSSVSIVLSSHRPSSSGQHLATVYSSQALI